MGVIELPNVGFEKCPTPGQGIGLGSLLVLRLLVERVYYRVTGLEISTIIPLSGDMYQLPPLPREGARG